jgi:hypothetical protein
MFLFVFAIEAPPKTTSNISSLSHTFNFESQNGTHTPFAALSHNDPLLLHNGILAAPLQIPYRARKSGPDYQPRSSKRSCPHDNGRQWLLLQHELRRHSSLKLLFMYRSRRLLKLLASTSIQEMTEKANLYFPGHQRSTTNTQTAPSLPSSSSAEQQSTTSSAPGATNPSTRFQKVSAWLLAILLRGT